MKKLAYSLIVLSLLVLVTISASATDGNLVTNGDFETPVVAATQGWDIYGSGDPELGWTVEWRSDVPGSWGGWTRPDPAHLELHRGVNGWLSYSGSLQHAEMDTDWNDHVGSLNNEPASVKIYQNLATCPGETYTLQYAWSPRPNHGNNTLEVQWDGAAIDTHTGSGGSNTAWTLATSTRTASTQWTQLAFIERGTNDSLGMFLDAVSVVGPTHPCVIEVDIDIKPGSDPNCFNNDDHGVIPVAILGSADFDVTQIDPGSVNLDSLAVKAVGKGNKLLAHIEDANGDGWDDLVVQIQDQDEAFTSGSGTAKITGQLWDGTPFEGSDSICVVP